MVCLRHRLKNNMFAKLLAGLLAAISAGGLIMGLFCALATAQTVESAYTGLVLDKCRHTQGKQEEDYGEWRCNGYDGIAVHVSAGDQRTYVSYGRNAKKEPAAKQTLASFNGEGEKIEWRSERGADGKLKPFATIMRWSTTVSSGDEPMKGEVLVVTRLAPGSICHVGYVDAKANPDGNALAQKIADEHARKFRCDTDKPIVLGNQGPGFSGRYGD
jgi:hypothetical protein